MIYVYNEELVRVFDVSGTYPLKCFHL